MGKIHTIVKVPWSIYYWVVNKATHVKVSPTLVHIMVSLIDIENITTQTEMAYHWLPTAVSLAIMDPNQPEPHMKLTISIRQD